MELMAAAAILSVVVAIAVPVLASILALREDAQRRQFAQLAVGNALEELATRHQAGEAVKDVAPTIRLPDDAAGVLPGAEFAVDVDDWDAAPRGVQVRARLTWTTDAGRRSAPVELYAYFNEPAPEAQR